MNRLQKKCLIATAGFHLLLVVILIVGPGFFTSKPKPDNLPTLDVIPATAIDAAFSSGVKAAQPPAPAPIVPPPQPIVTQPQPTPPAPAPKPEPQTFVDKVKEIFTPVPAKPDNDPVPTPKPEKAKPKPHEVKVNMDTVKRTTVKNPTTQKTADDSQQKEAQRQARAIALAARAIKEHSSTATAIDAPGDSSAAYANYGQIVKSIYDAAWTPPDDLANADENVKVRVTISRDGTVVSAHITSSSGDPKLDASIQRVLDRVTFIQEFPEGSTDKERSYNINFNPKTKQLIG
jgi:colicin import membrane protein